MRVDINLFLELCIITTSLKLTAFSIKLQIKLTYGHWCEIQCYVTHPYIRHTKMSTIFVLFKAFYLNIDARNDTSFGGNLTRKWSGILIKTKNDAWDSLEKFKLNLHQLTSFAWPTRVYFIVWIMLKKSEQAWFMYLKNSKRWANGDHDFLSLFLFNRKIH